MDKDDFIAALQRPVDSIIKSFNDLQYETLSKEHSQRCYLVCIDTINYFNEILFDSQISVQVKRSVRTNIILLYWYADQFSQLSGQVIGVELHLKHRFIKWQDTENAFSNNITSGCVMNQAHTDLRMFLDDAQNLVIEKVNNTLKDLVGLKVNVELICKFKNAKAEDSIEEAKSFTTKSREILPATSLADWYNDQIYEKLLKKVEDFNQRDSGWGLIEIQNLKITMSKYSPLQAGDSTYIELPKDIQTKKAVLNIQNFDEYCFLWCIVAALYPPNSGHPERKTAYPHFSSVLKYEGIKFPIALQDIPKFETLNNLSINVYGIESEFSNKKSDKSVIIPLYLSKLVKSDQKVIHLFLTQQNISDDLKNFQSKFHFTLIRNLSRLVKSQISQSKSKLFFCDRCLNHFKYEYSYVNHIADCYKMNKVHMTFPDERNQTLRFKNYHYKDTVPFVVYASLECRLETQGDDKTQKQVPHSIAFYQHCSYNNNLSKFRLHRSPHCIAWFVLKLRDLADEFEKYLKNPIPMKPLTKEQHDKHNQATVCHICEKTITSNKDKCHDYCHFTGNYRGPAHISCNLNYPKSHVIPVVFHNLSGYETHFLIKTLATYLEGKITLLPINKERYASFTKSIKNTSVILRFIDSFRFMPSSLEKLASYLGDNEKQITKLHYPDPEQFKLVTRKGAFPNEYISSISKLNDKQLPDQVLFFSKLSKGGISDQNYTFAQLIWNKFNITTLGEYSDLYLKTDVLLLADVFENFRRSCFTTYNLDPLHYYSAPDLSNDAMLKYTGVELQVLTDPEMVLFIEKGIRGGVSQCTNRYAAANNRYMSKNFDPSKTESYLMYYGVNNLYSAAMRMPLPADSFEWVENLDNVDEFLNDNDNNVGYILEVDLSYPEDLYELHKDLPLCPEHFVPPGSKFSKLSTTLYNKQNYVIHYKNLQQCLELGLKLTKIHRVLKFKQSPWLKSYIDKNIDCRKLAKNEFEKNFYELMNSAVFDKTIDNVRKHKDVQLKTKWDGRFGIKELICKPNFHSLTIVDKDMVIVEFKKVKVCFNKPIYVGFSILDLSKTIIYDFHYNYVKKNFKNDSSTLMYTDTDSLIYHFTVPDIYKIIKRDISKFDTSDYPIDNVYNMPLVNKQVLELMKDENNGQIMTEFIGLRAKLYTFKRYQNEKAKKCTKGVEGPTLRTIMFDDLKQCLENHVTLTKNQYLILYKKHNVTTIVQNKVALSWADDKRNLIDGSHDTLPWGYKRNEMIIDDDDDKTIIKKEN